MRILVFIVVFVALTTSIYLGIKIVNSTKELSLLKKEHLVNTQVLKQNKIYISSLQKQIQEQLKKDVDRLQDQQSSSSSPLYNESGVYISAKESPLSNGTRSIAFRVQGQDKTMFDAMDLGLLFSNIKADPICTTGDTFIHYPFIENKELHLNITGVADIRVGKMTTGTVNTTFVSCLFEKKDMNQITTIKLNPIKTHIYFLGKPILNLENSFTKTVW